MVDRCSPAAKDNNAAARLYPRGAEVLGAVLHTPCPLWVKSGPQLTFLGPQFTPAGWADCAVNDLAGIRWLELDAAVTLLRILGRILIRDHR
jgi:hypothetical protein